MKMTAMAGRRARIMTTAHPAKEALLAVIPIFLASRATVAGISPFGLCIFGALLPSAAGLAALALGSVLLGVEGIKYILCGATFYAVGFIRKLDRIAAAAVMGLILAVGSIIEVLWTGFAPIAAAAAVTEGVTGGLLFYIFGSLKAGTVTRTGALKTNERTGAGLLLLGTCINGLHSIQIPPGIPVTILLGLLSLMLICRSVDLYEATTAGLVLGILCNMNDTNTMAIMGIFAIGALLSSILSDLGKWSVVLGFLSSGALSVLCGGSIYSLKHGLWALTAAIGVFAILPEFVINLAVEKIRLLSDYTPDYREDRSFIERQIRSVTKQHSDICVGLKRICDELSRTAEEAPATAIYSINSAMAQRAAVGAAVSGDCFLEFETEQARHYAVLCDGMGSGNRAHKESRMTAELLREFLQTGFLKDKALAMINAILALKGDDESFSTVDLFEFDTATGDAEFLKIGSAQSFIRHKGEVDTLSSQSLPVGILDEVRTTTINRRLSAGDLVIIVSDGVGEAGYGVMKGEWIKRIIKNANCDMQSLADDILAEAVRRSSTEKDDDMTVIAMRIERAKKRD